VWGTGRLFLDGEGCDARTLYPRLCDRLTASPSRAHAWVGRCGNVSVIASLYLLFPRYPNVLLPKLARARGGAEDRNRVVDKETRTSDYSTSSASRFCRSHSRLDSIPQKLSTSASRSFFLPSKPFVGTKAYTHTNPPPHRQNMCAKEYKVRTPCWLSSEEARSRWAKHAEKALSESIWAQIVDSMACRVCKRSLSIVYVSELAKRDAVEINRILRENDVVGEGRKCDAMIDVDTLTLEQHANLLIITNMNEVMNHAEEIRRGGGMISMDLSKLDKLREVLGKIFAHFPERCCSSSCRDELRKQERRRAVGGRRRFLEV
jgi:hypothetical protein